MSGIAAAGPPPVSVHSAEHRLSYADCDPAGIVYFATWFPLMERVHTEWWLLQGLRFDTLLDRCGVVPVTRHTECSYTAVTRLFDVVRCAMAVESVGRTSYGLRFDFTLRPDGPPVAHGRLILVGVDRDGAPAPLPGELRAVLTAHR